MSDKRKTLTPEQVAAAEQAAAEKAIAEQAAAKKVDPAQKIAEKYHKSYPSCKTFYITSDEQVFLSDAYNMAALHQASLKEGKITTVKF